MNEWAFTDDPVELRIRLEVALEHIAVLEAENAELKARTPAPWPPLAAPTAPLPGAINSDAAADAAIPSTDHASPPEVKIALFRALFAGARTSMHIAGLAGRPGSPAGARPSATRSARRTDPRASGCSSR